MTRTRVVANALTGVRRCRLRTAAVKDAAILLARALLSPCDAVATAWHRI